MIARLLISLAAAVPMVACAAQPAGAASAAGPGAPPHTAQDTRKADAGTTPASVVPAPATQAVQAAAPDTQSGTAAGTTVGDGGSAAAGAADPGAQQAPAASPAAPAMAAPAPAPPPIAPVTMPSGSATGSLLQTMFALLAVLAILAGLAWFLKRYGPKMSGGSANLRIVGSLNLGGRERLLVVEIGEQWIVVGASPGRVNALATMPRQQGADAGSGGATLAAHGAQAASPAHSFADWLKQTIDKRK